MHSMNPTISYPQSAKLERRRTEGTGNAYTSFRERLNSKSTPLRYCSDVVKPERQKVFATPEYRRSIEPVMTERDLPPEYLYLMI